MTIHSLPLSVLRPSKTNPRTDINADRIKGLATSIKANGLLQNLIVVPLKGRSAETRYGLIAGHRRYQALSLLQQQGDLADDYEVPVTIRTDLTAEEKLRISTVENLQRENLPPMDAAQAFARLLKNRTTLEDLEAQTGLSTTTIKRRLALNSLCDEAQAELREGVLTLAQAEALTLGSAETQQDMLERITSSPRFYSAEQIKTHLLDDRLPVSVAIFPTEQYDGTITADLFADDDSRYFDDHETFWQLQRQAVTELAEHHRETAAWVDVTEGYTPSTWKYNKAEDGADSGVLINLSPTGKVEVVSGLAKPLSLPEIMSIGEDNPIVPKPKPAYSTPLRRYIAHHKSLAVQAALLSHPRKAKEVAVIMMMGGKDGWDRPLALTPHAALKIEAEAGQSPVGFIALEAHGTPLAAQVSPHAPESEQPIWERFFPGYRELSDDSSTLYDAVSNLSDADLDALHLLLPILCFGQSNCDELDTAASLFNRVGQELEVDMRQYWQPDAAFLKRRTTDQLIDIATESGAAGTLGELKKYRKAELVTALSDYFAGETPAARDWLPSVMQFPAVEPEVSTASAVAEPTAEEALSNGHAR